MIRRIHALASGLTETLGALLATAILITLTGCTSVTSYTTGERVEFGTPTYDYQHPFVVTLPEAKPQEKAALQALPAALLGLVVPEVVKFGYDSVKGAIDREAEKHTASWEGSRTAADFYQAEIATKAGTTVPVITLSPLESIKVTRTANLANGRAEPCTDFVLRIVPLITGDTFKLQLCDLHYTHPKAKVSKSLWDRGDYSADLSVKVLLSAASFSAKGEFANQEFANLEIPVRGVVPGQGREGVIWESKPLAYPPYQTPSFKALVAANLGKSVSFGAFNLTVSVTETNKLPAVIDRLKEASASNKDKIVQAISDSLLGKDETANGGK